MNSFRLRILSGNIQVELEGDGELVLKMYQEIKESGLGKLAEAQSANDNQSYPVVGEEFSSNDNQSDTTTISESSDMQVAFAMPPLNNVVLQGKPKTEAEWMLVYAAYCSNEGKTLFSRDSLRKKYEESKRNTASTKTHFAGNIKILAANGYISAVNTSDFRLEPLGLDKAKSIITGSINPKNGKRINLTKKKSQTASYTFLELGFSHDEVENIKHFWDTHSHSSNMDKAVLLAFWLKQNRNIDEVNVNHIFTLLRTLDETTSFDLAASLRNAKHKSSYFTNGSSVGIYKLNHRGEDRIRVLAHLEGVK